MCVCVCSGAQRLLSFAQLSFPFEPSYQFPNNVCLKPNLLLARNIIFFGDRVITEAIKLNEVVGGSPSLTVSVSREAEKETPEEKVTMKQEESGDVENSWQTPRTTRSKLKFSPRVVRESLALP